jgi:hypothetical protein
MKISLRQYNRLLTAIIIFIFPVFFINPQEPLLSDTERYYDFLSLRGLTERAYLNYRTLSDSVWNIDEQTAHPWQGQYLGGKKLLVNNIFYRIYGPELFTSYNTAYPYGYNDGALWQGKGFNTSFSTGVRFEGYGAELTFKPQLAFSQNLDFSYMESNIGNGFGYFWGTVDAPQRFGNEPFFSFDWGDSEIRYTWRTITIGFGTQAVWLGPAYLHPILHSNNAATYPKLDIGLRKQPVVIPFINWYLGDIEFRIWTGYLTESKYFDNIASNDHTMFHGLAFAYAPAFLPGLTLGVNRVCLVPWEWENLKYIVPEAKNTIEDQKASLSASYLLPSAGIEVYGELGIDDYVPDGILGYIRHPFHTTVYTIGLRKDVKIKPEKHFYGELIFEANWMEMTQDYQFFFPTSFYYGATQKGYTNRGQWLGSGLGTGGNSQYVAFKVFYPQGNSLLFISRNNPDNNYLYKNAINKSATDKTLQIENAEHQKANFIVGIDTEYFIMPSMAVSGGIIYDLIINPLYKRTEEGDLKDTRKGTNVYKHNFSFQLGVKWSI